MFFADIYTPKSSKHSVNDIGRPACVQRPGGRVLFLYPFALRRFPSTSWSRMPACGSPYIPLRIYM